MPNERNSAARVLSQEGDNLQVEHEGERLTVPMKGFPPEFKLQKGSRVILYDDPSGTVARPLTHVAVAKLSPEAVLKGGPLQVEGRRVQTQPATVLDRRAVETERDRGDQYVLWAIEDSGKDSAKGSEQQVVAIKKAR